MINRRNFLATTMGASAALSGIGAPKAWSASALPQAELGKTGIMVSRIAQGTGMKGSNRSSNQTRLGFEKLVGMMLHSYERGVTFFDMADLYGSHVYFREALRSIPREKVAVLTKLWWRYDSRKPSSLPAEYQARSAQLAIDRFRHEIATDYLDVVLLHCVTTPNWNEELAAYMDVLSQAKEKKQIRAVGVSCHSLDALKTAAESPWVDVVLARINPEGEKMDGTPEEVIPVLKRIKENGKGLIGMKIYGEGKLAHMKEECMAFAKNLGLLDSMTVGAESIEQMDETIELYSK